MKNTLNPAKIPAQTNRFQRLRRVLLELHRDDRGAEGLEKLLIIAAIVLPLLGLLIVFRGAISEWVNDVWGDVVGDEGGYTPPDLPTP